MRIFTITLLLIGSGLPAFPADKSDQLTRLRIENDRNTMLVYFLATVLVVAILAFIWFIRFVYLKKTRSMNALIESKNDQLIGINEWIASNTRFKEESIGHAFNIISDYILKLEKIKRGVERKIIAKKYEDILLSFNDINIKKEREKLFNTFDETFLKIFPNFILEFNAMFNPEDQVWPARNEGLSTDLRIFALMRLGINDCETIANFLEYSANTIYVYRTRIKARSIVPADQFDQAIMAIKAVSDQRSVLYRRSA